MPKLQFQATVRPVKGVVILAVVLAVAIPALAAVSTLTTLSTRNVGGALDSVDANEAGPDDPAAPPAIHSDPTRDLRLRVAREAPRHRRRALRYHYLETETTFHHRGAQDWVPEPAQTYRVIPIDSFLYRRLVSIGGRPLSERQERREETREEEFRREHEGVPDPERGRFRRVLPIEKFVDRYEYRFLGEETIRGRPTVVLEFKPGEWQGEMFGNLDRIFRNLEGRLWIDREDAQVVLVEGRLREKVRWGMGLVASLHTFELEVEQRRVDDSTWMPHRVWYQAEGSAFLFGRIRKQRLSRFHGFAPLDSVQSLSPSGCDSRNRSASSAAMQPVPAAVIACR